ncbi:MAG: hypothetical protein J6V09_01190 [Clostridia bacterium]|nr:hypothetical protein [Clostridia bacterium]
MVKIPISFVLEMDDVGWDDGRDLRLKGKASRSGFPRNHTLEDYEFLNQLAEATGKKISVALTMADWDKDNVLRGEVGITHDPYGWDRKSEIDVKKFEGYRDALDAGNLDFMVHSLLHGRYTEDGVRLTEKEFTPLEILPDGKPKFLFSEEDFRHRLDLFFKIFNSWGFEGKVRGIVFPSGVPKDKDIYTRACKVLSEFGIIYWGDHFDFPEEIKIINGVACFKWGMNDGDIPWNAYDFDPDVLGDYYAPGSDRNSCMHGSHWTNFLRFNPKKNVEGVEPWARFYKRQSEIFGSALARDLPEAVNQLIHRAHSTVEKNADGYKIDLSGVSATNFSALTPEFLVSFTKDEVPVACDGGSIDLYEEKKDFRTYKISYNTPVITIKTK